MYDISSTVQTGNPSEAVSGCKTASAALTCSYGETSCGTRTGAPYRDPCVLLWVPAAMCICQMGPPPGYEPAQSVDLMTFVFVSFTYGLISKVVQD